MVERSPDGFVLPDGVLEKWQGMFPLVDVPAVLRYAHAYAEARPTWARRRKDWNLTLLNWLKREQERAQAGRLRQNGHQEEVGPRSEPAILSAERGNPEVAERYLAQMRAMLGG